MSDDKKSESPQGLSYVAADVLRRIFDYLVSAEAFATASSVCKYWRTACDHDSVWRTLAQYYQWPHKGKRWFMTHFGITRHFLRAPYHHIELKGSRRAGVQMLCSPRPQSAFDWRSGKYVTSNFGLVISGSSAPDYGFAVWDANAQKAIREFSVLMNPRVRIVQAPPVVTPEPSADDAGVDVSASTVIHTPSGSSTSSSSSSSSASSSSSGSSSSGDSDQKTAAPPPPAPAAAPAPAPAVVPGAGPGGYVQAPGSVYQWSSAHIHGNILFFSTAQYPSLFVADFAQATNPNAVTPHLRISQAHASTITAVHCNEPHMIGASVSYDKHLRLWDLKSGSLLRDYAFSHRCWCVEINSDGHTVACGSDKGYVHVYDNDGLVSKLEGHENSVMVATFAPSLHPNALCTGSYDATIKIWDFRAGTLLRTLEGHTNVVFSIQVLDHVLLSGSRDDSVRLWDPFSGTFLRQMAGSSTKAAVILSETKFATAGLRDQVVHVWDFTPGASGAPTTVIEKTSSKGEDCNVM